MTKIYLSPAFSQRSDEDLEILKQVDENSGFFIFWIDIVKPLLQHIQALSLLEIGAYRGDHTRLLLRYCEICNGSLIVIEPAVLTDLQEIVDQSKKIRLYAAKSREALPLIEAPIDAVLLEGDLNYHSIYNDLSDIANLAKRHQTPFPLVFLRATGWPYARRDMYYNQDDMPAEGVHDNSRIGMSQWSPDLQFGMINQPFANATREGGQRNGVLTAAEDFIRDSSLPLQIVTFPIHNGLSILYLDQSSADRFIRDRIYPDSILLRLMETVEVARLNGKVKLQEQQLLASTGIISRWEQRLHRLIHRIFKMAR
jgi:hypothetical protein